ncbi:MAG: hypothetical protein HYZ73_05565 [Elusimicrobia bacterium]|nr:hypothetical protein [Elusimicrobiota bacterium]
MGKSIVRIVGVCGTVAVMLWAAYWFMARGVRLRGASLGGRPQTASERARLQAQVQKTMKMLEEQRRLQDQFRLGQPSGTVMPGQGEALKALKSIEEINRLNRMNQELRPQSPPPPPSTPPPSR